MNDDVQFLTWAAREHSNTASISHVFADSSRNTLAMQISKEAHSFCRGPSSALLQFDNNEEMVLEGIPILHFYQNCSSSIENLQIFQFYQDGSSCLSTDYVVARLSRWDRKSSINELQIKPVDYKKIWNCSANSILIFGKETENIIDCCKQLGNLILAGLVFFPTNEEAIKDYSLSAYDSGGNKHLLDWNNKTCFPDLEKRITELESLVQKTTICDSTLLLTFVFRN